VSEEAGINLIDSRRLLLTAKPVFDETLMGFVLRLTELNGYETPAWILELSRLNHNRFGYSCPFVFGEPTSLTHLSGLTGIELSELTNLIYPPVESDDAASDDHLFFCSPVPKQHLRPVQTKICPACLRESNYYRKVWDLAAITVCPAHKALLLDGCPNCHRRILWRRKNVSVCTCGCDWREAALPRVGESELKVTKHIHRLCGYQFPDSDSGYDESNPILNLDLKTFLSYLLFIAGQYQNIAATKGKFVGPKARNSELHSHLSKAFDIFDNWPHNFHKFLEWRQKNNCGSYRSLTSKTGLYKDFGRFYEGLWRESDTGQLDILRDAFSDYVAQHWRGGQVSKTSKQIVMPNVDQWKYVSRNEARLQLGIDHYGMKRLIAAGRLKTVVLEGGSTRQFLVEVSSLENLKREFSHSVSFSEVRTQLGISKHLLKRLIEYGIIEALRGPTADGSFGWKFRQDAAEGFLERLGSGVTSPASVPAAGVVNFYKSARTLSPLGLKIADFIRAILGGEITPCGVTSDVGISRFMFKEASVARFAQAVKSGA